MKIKRINGVWFFIGAGTDRKTFVIAMRTLDQLSSLLIPATENTFPLIDVKFLPF